MTRSHPPARQTYRHGDLRRALVEAGLALAREHGPAAVALREVTRRAGVVPNAAYRHFANHAELLRAVRGEALALAARSMEDELDAASRATAPGSPAAEGARARLRAIGAGYLAFAWREPGLFRTAFGQPGPPGELAPDSRGRSGLNPFELLGASLDALVDAGVLPAARRPRAEFIAWSAVHGLAMLALEGPLQGTPRAELDAIGTRLLEAVERGI